MTRIFKTLLVIALLLAWPVWNLVIMTHDNNVSDATFAARNYASWEAGQQRDVRVRLLAPRREALRARREAHTKAVVRVKNALRLNMTALELRPLAAEDLPTVRARAEALIAQAETLRTEGQAITNAEAQLQKEIQQ